MIAPFANQSRLDEAHTNSFADSRSSPFHSLYRVEYAREWGPCVLGIEQSARGPLSGMGPAVFCGTIMPCAHEAVLESQGIVSASVTGTLSSNEQERLSNLIQSDPYIAWVLKAIPSEAADGARCSMGVLEHTTAASIIKEAIASGADIRCIRVSANCDPARFRQFLYEAFPMIDDISVYPRIASTSNTNSNPCVNVGSNTVICQSPCVPHSLPSSPNSPSSALSSSSSIPVIICAAGVVAQSARDSLSRQMLYRQRQSPSPLSRSPLARRMTTVRNSCSHDSFGGNSAAASFFNGPLFRGRSSSEENAHRATRRCAAFAGSEFGEAHCGLVSELTQPVLSQSQTVPIEMYDFGGDDDESTIAGLTSPKRIRVVPCSPPLPSVITCEDTIPCTTHATVTVPSASGRVRHIQSVDSFDSSPFSSTSLFVSPPPFASGASTSVPMFRPMCGLTSLF